MKKLLSTKNITTETAQTHDSPFDKSGRFIIRSRKKQYPQVNEEGRIIIGPRKKLYAHDENLQSQSNEDWEDFDDRQAAFQSSYEENTMNQIVISDKECSISSDEQRVKSKKKKDKKKKHKHKKSKKYKSKKSGQLSVKYLTEIKTQTLMEKRPQVSSVLSSLISSSSDIVVENGNIRIYDEEHGYYRKLDNREANIKVVELLDSDERLAVNQRTIADAVKSVLITPEIQKELSNSVNTPFINCRNGVLDIQTGRLKEHSSKYEFKEFIDAEYNFEATCKYFEAFIEDVCMGKKDLIYLIQEVMGYAFSSYIFLKKSILFSGTP